ncbi:hypothetical protein MUGA111182_07740 [Mucilaginibacter galii]|nr:hypothetical protein [Mucilaginibacter galii]
MKGLKKAYAVITIIFLLAFPKGGFKIGEIPLTWGYMLFLIALPFIMIRLCLNNFQFKFSKKRQLCLLLCLPFIFYSSISLCFSTFDSNLGGFLSSYILSILVMPIICLMCFNSAIDEIYNTPYYDKVFLWCLRFVIVFGLALFVQKILTGKILEIPYLTVNIADYGHIDEKFNLRGDLMKLTSTYNNGNIYGVCMLLLTPFYIAKEPKKIFKILFFAALALTLSRTVWIGMIIFLLLIIIKNLKNIKGYITLGLTVIGVILIVPLLLKFMNLDLNFLTDKDLGGRAHQLSILDNFTLFSAAKFQGITEIVYASMLTNFGLVGLILFVIYILSPLITLYRYPQNRRLDNTHWGILIYVIICASDGAMLLIPVMAFFWFLSSYTLSSTSAVKYLDLQIN